MKTQPILSALFLPLLGCSEKPDKAAIKESLQRAAGTAMQSIEDFGPEKLTDFRAQILGLKESLTARDFGLARTHAEKVDTLLNSGMVAQSIDFLKVDALEGAEKAKSAVTQFMLERGVDLRLDEKKMYQEMLVFFDNPENRKQVITLVGIIVYLALEHKLSHSASIPSGLAVALLEELMGVKLDRENPFSSGALLSKPFEPLSLPQGNEQGK